MPEELNDPTGNDPMPEPSPRGGRTIKCEACESILHPSGDVKKKSDSLKALEKLESENESLRVKLTAAEAKIAESIAPDDPPAPEAPPKFRRHFIEAA